jgi:hypothetical protein
MFPLPVHPYPQAKNPTVLQFKSECEGRSQINPRPPPRSHPPPRHRPRPQWRASSGAEQGPGSHPWITRGRSGTARADDPRNPGPTPNRLQAIALPQRAARAALLRFSSHRAATVRPSRGRSCQAAGQGS